MKKLLNVVMALGLFSLSACGESTEDTIMRIASEEINTEICFAKPSNRRGVPMRDALFIWGLQRAEYVEEAKSGDFDFFIGTAPMRYTDKASEITNDKNQICYAEVKVTDISDISDEFQEQGSTFVNADAVYKATITAPWMKALAEDTKENKGSAAQYKKLEATLSQQYDAVRKYRFKKHDTDGWVIDGRRF